MDDNPFLGKKAILDELLQLVEAKNVTAQALSIWAQAKHMAGDAAETREQMREENRRGECCYTDEEINRHGVWAEFEAQFDAAMDDARDLVQMDFDDTSAAMVEMYGER